MILKPELKFEGVCGEFQHIDEVCVRAEIEDTREDASLQSPQLFYSSCRHQFNADCLMEPYACSRLGERFGWCNRGRSAVPVLSVSLSLHLITITMRRRRSRRIKRRKEEAGDSRRSKRRGRGGKRRKRRRSSRRRSSGTRRRSSRRKRGEEAAEEREEED